MRAPPSAEQAQQTNATTELITTIDLSMSLEQMIAAGKYEWVNNFITVRRFPIQGTGIKRFRNRLFHFGRSVSSQYAVDAMKEQNFLPGTHIHGLAFGATFPDEQRKYPIVCLGSSPRVHFVRYVVCLSRFDAGRSLSLHDWGDDWDDYWRFLGVQEVSGP